MLLTKRESRCTPISPSIGFCSVDILVISLILLAVGFCLFVIPLADNLRDMLRRKRKDSPSSSRTAVSSHNPSQRGSRMSPRRHDSQETLLDELNIGDDKLDAIPLDPFLVVQPSLNDSLLVKQGLVEETTLPQPTHSAYDIQGSPSCQIERNADAFESSSRMGSRRGTDATANSHRASISEEGGMVRIGDSCETAVPPAAHTVGRR